MYNYTFNASELERATLVNENSILNDEVATALENIKKQLNRVDNTVNFDGILRIGTGEYLNNTFLSSITLVLKYTVPMFKCRINYVIDSVGVNLCSPWTLEEEGKITAKYMAKTLYEAAIKECLTPQAYIVRNYLKQFSQNIMENYSRESIDEDEKELHFSTTNWDTDEKCINPSSDITINKYCSVIKALPNYDLKAALVEAFHPDYLLSQFLKVTLDDLVNPS
jgi:hypothetical protein